MLSQIIKTLANLKSSCSVFSYLFKSDLFFVFAVLLWILTCKALMFSSSWAGLEAPSSTEFTLSFLRHQAVKMSDKRVQSERSPYQKWNCSNRMAKINDSHRTTLYSLPIASCGKVHCSRCARVSSSCSLSCSRWPSSLIILSFIHSYPCGRSHTHITDQILTMENRQNYSYWDTVW